MKKLEQKIYHFGTLTGDDIKTTDKLIVCIGREKTRLSAANLFAGYKQREDSIKGYSILGELPIEENMLMVYANGVKHQISFFNEDSQQEIFISKITDPLIQSADIEIDEVPFLEMIQAEFDFISSEDKPEITASINEENIELNAESEEQVEAVNDEDEPLIEDASFYEKDVLEALEGRYKEAKYKNYRFLYKPKDENEGAKAILVHLLVDDYEMVKFTVKEKSESRVVIEFNDKNTLNYNIINNTLLVS